MTVAPTEDIERALQAILVGITAEDGLRFNRAFLAIFEDEGNILQGK